MEIKIAINYRMPILQICDIFKFMYPITNPILSLPC